MPAHSLPLFALAAASFAMACHNGHAPFSPRTHGPEVAHQLGRPALCEWAASVHMLVAEVDLNVEDIDLDGVVCQPMCCNVHFSQSTA